MNHTLPPWLLRAAFILTLATGATTISRADARLAPAAPPPAAYSQECSSCHMAYPAGLLPAASWQRLMSQLREHFGADAGLDAATQADITRWLAANAGTGKRARELPPQERITRAGWFVREHREIGAAVFARPSIKSASNCSACHAQAEQGDFDEHRIRIPR